jgi:hypothetical protein
MMSIIVELRKGVQQCMRQLSADLYQAAEQRERATEMLISSGNQIKSLESSLATSKAELMDVQERTAGFERDVEAYKNLYQQEATACAGQEILLFVSL